ATEHRERFPQGQLGAERELIAIEALVGLGRDAEARRRARALGREGLYRERIEALVGALEPATP
ncbi:MAG: hypothetical protein OEY14_15710, partial [Myxococcales bacterium]|nr:hypothetical protein [Myxococcales bacterium]